MTVDPRRAVELAELLREIVKMEASEFGDLAIEAMTLGALAIRAMEYRYRAHQFDGDATTQIELDQEAGAAESAYLAAAHPEGKT